MTEKVSWRTFGGFLICSSLRTINAIFCETCDLLTRSSNILRTTEEVSQYRSYGSTFAGIPPYEWNTMFVVNSRMTMMALCTATPYFHALPRATDVHLCHYVSSISFSSTTSSSTTSPKHQPHPAPTPAPAPRRVNIQLRGFRFCPSSH